MSDYDRNKFYGKKKYPPSRESSTFGSRFFNSKSAFKTERDITKEFDKAEKSKSVKQPTILIKTRDHTEDRSISPKPKPTTRESEASNPISIATSSTLESSSTPCVKEMTRCTKLLDEGVIYSENIQDYLQENNDFLVIGVVGTQGVGKSTIMNLLANNQVTEQLKKALFEVSTCKENALDSIKILSENLNSMKVCDNETQQNGVIFKQQTLSNVETNSNAGCGIDYFITGNRIMFLDCQPFTSVSVLDDLIHSENKRSNVVSEYLPLENSGEIHGLQLTTFLMSVCHVLILVQDWFFDSNIIRFMQSAEMLKPTMSNPEDEMIDHFPHLVLVHNKAEMEDFSPKKFKIMQQMYRSMFNKTKMHIESGIGLGSGKISNSLCPENCGDPLNLFLIPEYDDKESLFKGHPPLEDLVKRLRSNILGATKYPLTHVQLNEKNWLIYCSKVWDHVRKSNFFVEYTKLMP